MSKKLKSAIKTNSNVNNDISRSLKFPVYSKKLLN